MKQPLNFSWSFVPSFEEAFLSALPEEKEKIDLPHAAKASPLHYFDEKSYQGLFTYEKIFDLLDPAAPVHLLVFEGAMLKIRVYLNGHDYGTFVSGFLPVTIDVSAEIKDRRNRLLVVLDSNEDSSVPPFGKAVDYLTFGGIYRPVSIESHAETYVDSIFIHGAMDGTLTVKAGLKGPVGEKKTHFALFDGADLVKEFDEETVAIDHPHLWSVADPHLYRLVSMIGNEEREDSFGFRDAVFTDKGFFLNGKKLKLIGLNRHQTYPYVGPAMPKAGQIDDAHLLKEKLGCNIVRTSHYADDESFLEECDRIGLLLIDEVPGWQYIGKDEAWRSNYYDFVKRLVIKERNHPSLIGYGLRIDESPDDHELYTKAETIAKGLDPFRQTIGVRNFKGSECLEDVYGYNDFSCSGLDHGLDDPHSWKAPKGKGMLVTEYNGHMFPTKSFDPNDRRVEQALRHARVLDDAYAFPYLSGAVGWCAFDYNTHKDFGSGDHICYHGVSDIFRNPKYAAAVYASQTQSNVFEVASSLAVGDSDECLMRPVYVFTDADSVELYRNDHFIGRFLPDKKDFPHLPHPPILVDDFIGDTFEEPRFRKGDYKMMKLSLNAAAQNGFGRIPLKCKLFMAKCLIQYRLSFDDLIQIYSKYISSWGEKAAVWEFRGIKDGKKVAVKKVGPSTSFHYLVSLNKAELINGETYDVARLALRKVDQFGTRMPYAGDPIAIETSGPIEILGPRLVALEGGATAIYVRSLLVASPTPAVMTIRGEGEPIKVEFLVK